MSNLTEELQQKNNNYNIATTLTYARENFAAANLAEMIKNGCFTPHEKGFTLRFIDREFLVEYPLGIVTDLETGEAAADNVQVLILHHAVKAPSSPLLGNKISYKELPGGDIYIDPFTGRCIRPLIGIFASNLSALEKAVGYLDCQKESLGDLSYTIRVFPKVPITLIVYEADDEFPANGNILFDGAAAQNLTTEDYAVLCSVLIGRLKKLAFA